MIYGTCFERVRCIELWWLGLRAAVGALVWLEISGFDDDHWPARRTDEERSTDRSDRAISLTWVMLFLPFLQILMAESNRFKDVFNVREVRRRFRHAPIAMT